MVTYVYGDLFEVSADYLMEQKNCFHIHGGLSAIMAKRFPEAALADKNTPYGDLNKLGTYEIVDCDSIKVINAYGQYSIGGTATDYQAWEKILSSLVQVLPEGSSVKIPFLMGCGMGGGYWPDMIGLLRHHFEKAPLFLLICVRESDEHIFESLNNSEL